MSGHIWGNSSLRQIGVISSCVLQLLTKLESKESLPEESLPNRIGESINKLSTSGVALRLKSVVKEEESRLYPSDETNLVMELFQL